MASIIVHDATYESKYIRFMRNDRVGGNSRMHYVIGNHLQHVYITPEREVSSEIFRHPLVLLHQICESIEEATGISIPEDFFRGTDVFNVNGLLWHDGVNVPFRVMRQQIFLGAGLYAYSEEDTWRMMYHCIGNAIWNFIDHKIWNKEIGPKDEYRQLRGIDEYDSSNRGVGPRIQIFNVAAEDFRFLFGPSSAGSGEWNLRNVRPPNPEVTNFWNKEIEKYASYNQETTFSKTEVEPQTIS